MSKMKPGNLDQFRDLPVHVSGVDYLDGISEFERMGLSPILLRNVKAEYRIPLPIQQHAIPNILNGRDVMGHSVTGSGKTAAYAIPLLQLMFSKKFIMPNGSNRRIKVQPGETVKPKATIMLPTRELALQVLKEFIRFAKGTDASIKAVYGGPGTLRVQLTSVIHGCDILVATPGRLLDFIRRDMISMEDCQYLILDEADRMLDLGFEPQVRKIVERGLMMPKGERQSLLFSATYSDEIQKLCRDFLFNRIKITVGEIGAANSDIMQQFVKLNPDEKSAHLFALLDGLLAGKETVMIRVLIFVEKTDDAQSLATNLVNRGYDANCIHGKMTQHKRELALDEFKNGEISVLVATNIAARGLDIPNIKMVINYDLPRDIDEYVQRIGRTGRIGNKGDAIAFFDPKRDRKLAKHLVKILADAAHTNPDQETPAWLLNAAGVKKEPGYFDFEE